MEEKRIFLASPHMSDEGYEMDYIKEAFDTNWIAPLGANVTNFEKEMSDMIGCKASLALGSGTAAMHMAVKLLGIGKGDIVFCQSLTFSATVNPVIYEGAEPVFIDSDMETWNMSPEALKKAFKKYDKLGKLPKAVIIVHLYGLAVNIDAISSICQEYDVPIIEDAAESLGTSYKGRMTGSFGKYSIVSFNGNKIITSSGGGMLLCNGANAKEDAKKALFWSTQARDNARYYQHSELGYNYRMSNIVAGVGRGQLKVLNERVEKKRKIFNAYKMAFEDIKDIEMMPIHDEIEYSNCWLSCLALADTSKVKPIDIIMKLEEHNIEARHIWKPMHMQPFFSECDYIDNDDVSKKLFELGICLPSDTKMNNEEQFKVIELIKNLWK